MRNPELVEVPCDHSEKPSTQLDCKLCCGRGFRYVPRGWTAREFDAAFAQLQLLHRE